MEKVATTSKPAPLEVQVTTYRMVDADIAHQLSTHYEAYIREVRPRQNK